jgi:energy-coupling factor transport system permease protein
VLFGGDVGLLVAALFGVVLVAASGGVARWLRLLLGLAPLLVVLLLLDLLAGDARTGARVSARIVVLAAVGFGFALNSDAELLVAGLRALHVPYAVTFVLVAGARFVPTTLADLADLRDAARLRGVVAAGSPAALLRGWSVLLVPLLVVTVRRGLQLGEAMEARAFGAAPRRTVRYHLAWRPRDTIALLAAVATALGVLVSPRLLTI